MGAAYLRGPRGAHAPEPPLTEELLTAAMHQVRRPSWPTTLPEALADPLIAPIVRGLARSLQRQRAMRSVQGSTPPTQHRPPARPKQRLAFDHKKAASNDRDD